MKTRMRRFFKIAIVAALALPLVCSCSDSSKKELAGLVRELADKDATIDSDDWKKIAEFMDANKAHMKEFYKDGHLDEDAVKEYIQKMYSKGKDQKDITFWGKADKRFLTVKFYLERSGSMVSYDSPQTSGEFKKAIVKMLNSLPSDNEDNIIFVVNDAVYNYPKSYKEFITDNNIFKTTEGIGDPKYTDFGLILDSILNKNERNELSILASDMIYSTRDLTTVNKQKVLNEAEGVANAIFKEKAIMRTTRLRRAPITTANALTTCSLWATTTILRDLRTTRSILLSLSLVNLRALSISISLMRATLISRSILSC